MPQEELADSPMKNKVFLLGTRLTIVTAFILLFPYSAEADIFGNEKYHDEDGNTYTASSTATGGTTLRDDNGNVTNLHQGIAGTGNYYDENANQYRVRYTPTGNKAIYFDQNPTPQTYNQPSSYASQVKALQDEFRLAQPGTDWSTNSVYQKRLSELQNSQNVTTQAAQEQQQQSQQANLQNMQSQYEAQQAYYKKQQRQAQVQALTATGIAVTQGLVQVVDQQKFSEEQKQWAAARQASKNNQQQDEERLKNIKKRFSFDIGPYGEAKAVKLTPGNTENEVKDIFDNYGPTKRLVLSKEALVWVYDIPGTERSFFIKFQADQAGVSRVSNFTIDLKNKKIEDVNFNG